MEIARQTWLVWWDPFNDEALAIEEAECPPALRRSLDRERVVLHPVVADTRHAAVLQVFPQPLGENLLPAGHA